MKDDFHKCMYCDRNTRGAACDLCFKEVAREWELMRREAFVYRKSHQKAAHSRRAKA